MKIPAIIRPIIFIFFLVQYRAYAQDSLNVTRVASLYSFWMTPLDVKVAGDYAYYACRFSGLRILDISDPQNPLETGHLQTYGDALELDIQGDYTYIANWDNATAFTTLWGDGMEIVDISDAYNPQRVSFFQTADGNRAIDVLGNFAYLGSDDGNFYVINISNPANPFLSDGYNLLGYISSVFVAGNFCYCLSLPGGLHILNISNPDSIFYVGWCNTLHPPSDVLVDGDYAYITEGDDGIEIMNVHNPAEPFSLGMYNTPGEASSITKDGDYLYVAAVTSGVRILNAGNPHSIFEVGSFVPNFSGDAYIYNMAVQGDYMYTSGYAYGPAGESFTHIVNVSSPSNPLGISYYNNSGYISDIELKDDYALLTEYSSYMRVVDISDVNNPVEVTIWDSITFFYGIELYGDYAYCGTYQGLYILNVSDPEQIYIENLLANLPGINYKIYQDYLFRLGGDDVMEIYDLAEPTQPAYISTYQTSNGDPVVIAFNGNLAYVVTEYRLEVVDISNIYSPVRCGYCASYGGYYKNDTEYYGDYVYIAQGTLTGSIYIFNVSDSANPYEVTPGLTTTGCPRGLSLSGNNLISANYNGGLQIFRLENPSSPTLVGYYITGADVQSIAERDNFVYLAETYYFSIYDCSAALSYLSPPTVTITKMVDGFLLSWNSIPDAAFYNVYQGDEPYQHLSEMILIATTPDTLYMDFDPGIEPKFYKVTAGN